MQATVRKPATSFGNPLLANALGVMIAALVAAALTSTPVPLLGSDSAVYLAVLVLGMAMCALGGVGRAPTKYGWAHPVTLFGIVVGTVMLLLAAGVLSGQVAARVGLSAFAVLLAMKWAVGLAFVR
jgi:hypothetical protein